MELEPEPELLLPAEGVPPPTTTTFEQQVANSERDTRLHDEISEILFAGALRGAFCASADREHGGVRLDAFLARCRILPGGCSMVSDEAIQKAWKRRLLHNFASSRGTVDFPEFSSRWGSQAAHVGRVAGLAQEYERQWPPGVRQWEWERLSLGPPRREPDGIAPGGAHVSHRDSPGADAQATWVPFSASFCARLDGRCPSAPHRLPSAVTLRDREMAVDLTDGTRGGSGGHPI